MTKARDLANSAAAFAAVSATELGYVDGVTSAIQTQLDAKAPSSTAVTLTGTQTLTNKTLTSPALTTPTISTATTNGDILYGTGSGALTRLGIGTTGQVLNVAGGVPAWATASSGALTLVKRVSFSGVATTTTSFDSVFNSTYNTYLIIFESILSSNVGALRWNWRIAGVTQSNNSYQGNSYGYQANAALMNDNFNPGTYATMKATGTSTHISGSIYAARVGQSITTPYYYGHLIDQYNHAMLNVSSDYNNNANHDGFILTASVGTLTGSVSVYGLAMA